MEDILACLQTLAADAEVQIVRINNKLDEGYDSRVTAGYRDVSLNLRLCTPATRRLGLDGFVCELQLLLIDFARVKVSHLI